MATTDGSPLESWYERSIGEPSTTDEVYGYWMFALGILAGFIGIGLVVLSSGPGQTVRGAGIGLAALGLVLVLVGQILRLPLERAATALSAGGAVLSVVAVGWFLVAFDTGNWGSAFAHSESLIIGLYGIGILVMAVGSIVTPLVTGPREKQAAAEARASEARAQRDEARRKVTQHEAEDDRQAAAVADAGTEQAAAEARASEAEAQRDAAMAEITRLREKAEQQATVESTEQPDSQSTFELYTDSAGEYRWRLRHDNGNIIADGSEGYSSRQSAVQGLDAVRRDAVGASTVELDERETESDDPDGESEGMDDPDDESGEIDDPEPSQSQFELYTDSAGQYRWRLRHDNGNIIADGSQGYASRQSAVQGLDAVKRDVAEASVLDRDEMDGDERPVDTTDGQSRIELYTDSAGEYRWRLRHENGNIIADSAEGYSSQQKAMQGLNAVKRDAVGATVLDLDESTDESGDQGNETETSTDSPASQSQFELYTDNGEEYRWRLRHNNGNIIADGSQGYASRQSAMQGLDAVKRDMAEASVLDIDRMDGDERPADTTDGQSRIELYTDSAGEYRWRLRHDNGNIIADSAEGYSSRQKARQGLSAVKRDAVGATVLDLDEMDDDEQ